MVLESKIWFGHVIKVELDTWFKLKDETQRKFRLNELDKWSDSKASGDSQTRKTPNQQWNCRDTQGVMVGEKGCNSEIKNYQDCIAQQEKENPQCSGLVVQR